MTPEQIKKQIAKLKKASGRTPLVLSAQSRQGVPEALRALIQVIGEAETAGNENTEETAWYR